MASREIVVQALTYGFENDVCADRTFKYGDMPASYNVNHLMADALVLLKTLEPRILTLEELMGFDGAFLIEYNPSMLTRKANWAMFHFMDEKQVHIWRPRLVEHYAIAQYGVTWRCWNIRPSQAEMEAMPWNGSR